MNNFAKFSAAISSDPALQEKLQLIHEEAARRVAEQITSLSSEIGTPFTTEEFVEHLQEQSRELSDEQLQTVAGGLWDPTAGNILGSIFTFGAGCLLAMAISAGANGDARGANDCQFQKNKTR